ncbi:MAG TPA: MraY family glycosyltransferase [Phycisphaerae bacterium]|nr:MraY family glycosyltransferase [Phycisphaerae bacterium]
MTGLVSVSLAVSLALGLVGTVLVRGCARRRGFVDAPGGHKAHLHPVALGGGIAIFWSVVLPLAAGLTAAWIFHARGAPAGVVSLVERFVGAGRFAPLLGGLIAKTPTALAIVGGAFVLHILGLIDDRRPLGPGVKLTVEALAAALVAAFGLRIAEFLGPVLSVAVTVLWLVVVTNAMNFLDNMDGLAAGVTIIACGVLAAAGAANGQIFVPVLCGLVLGAAAGFLPYNFPPASIFMGDAGSLPIGYLLAVLAVLTTYYDPALHLQPFGFFLPVVVLAVPLYDVTTVVWHRLRAGAPLFVGDRRHFSHRLTSRGLSPRAAVLTIYLATAATALPATFLPRATWPTATVVFAQCMCILFIVAVLEHTGTHGQAK